MRILLANELGSGTGHLHTAATLGAALTERGHVVAHAMRDLVAAQRHRLLACRPLLQAPTLPPRAMPAGVLARDHAALLLQAGYGDVDAATGALCAWRGLLGAARADAVIAEHAPLALLAARANGLPAVALGTGFSVPPAIRPLSRLDADGTGGAADDSAEGQLLATFAAALDRLGSPRLDAIAQLYAADRARLLSLPAFDHYGVRGADACAGLLSVAEPEDPVRVSFPDGDGPRTLAYRHPGYGGFEDLARLLAATGLPSLLVAPGLDPARASRLAGGRLRIVGHQVDLRVVLAETDRAIVHGGHGTTARVVLAGLPCLVLPWFLEQALLGRRLEEAGLARVATRMPSAATLEAIFAEQETEGPRGARRAFRAIHAADQGLADMPQLMQWIEARLAPAAPPV